MEKARSNSFLVAALALAAPACSDGGKSPTDDGPPCTAEFKTSDAGQPATITVDTSATLGAFTPQLLFGVNVAYWVPQTSLLDTQAKVQAAGNFALRYPGGSASDDYHWNGKGSYDDQQHWVPSAIEYAPGFQASESFRGTTSGGYGAYGLVTDGDPTTRWLSNADTDFPTSQWLYVDLGGVKPVDSLQIVWGTPYAASFEVQTWSGTAAWPPPYQAVGNAWQATSAGVQTGAAGTQTVTFTPVSTQFVRILMTSSSAGPGGAYSIAEVTAYSGTTQLSTNTASTSQSATTASSTDPASRGAPQSNFDFEAFMTYANSFSPAALPVLTVNVGTGTPAEAAAWVHYANVVRGYGIRYWQVGNEMEGNWETGGPLNARDYVRRYLAFYDAMKAEDPTIVVLGPVSGGISEPSGLGDGKTFIEDFIALLAAQGKADHIDGIDFHWYPNYGMVSDAAGLAQVAQLGGLAQNLKSWLAAAGAATDLPVFLTEYNMGLGATDPPVYDNQLVNGLFVANTLGEYARLFGKNGATFLWLAMSSGNTADATDATAGDLGYLQSTNNAFRYQERASYWAMQMMSSLWAIAGDTRAHTLVASTSSQSLLATYADLRPDGALTLAVINRDDAHAYSARIDLAPFVSGPAADVWTFDARNYVWETAGKPYHAEPDTAPTHALFCGAGASTPFAFAPASLTVIRFAAPGAPTAAVPDAAPVAVADAGPDTAHSYVLVDDMEMTDSGPIQLDTSAVGQAPGAWFSGISTGSTTNAMAPEPFAFTALAASHETMTGITSTRAAHLTCSIADQYGYCQEGFTLVNPEGPFDASKYDGIVFWGMSPQGNTIKVQFPNDDTVPTGGKCGQTDAAADQCWDSFATSVSLTSTWQRFEVKFSDVHQDGWGMPVGIFDAASLRGVNFQILGPTTASGPPVTADFWIDDVYFE
jgi:alpha-L-arabinofuranosidase